MPTESWFQLTSAALRFLAGWAAPLSILAYEFNFALRLRRATHDRTTRVSATAGLIVGMALWVYVVFRYPPHELLSVFPALPALVWVNEAIGTA